MQQRQVLVWTIKPLTADSGFQPRGSWAPLTLLHVGSQIRTSSEGSNSPSSNYLDAVWLFTELCFDCLCLKTSSDMSNDAQRASTSTTQSFVPDLRGGREVRLAAGIWGHKHICQLRCWNLRRCMCNVSRWGLWLRRGVMSYSSYFGSSICFCPSRRQSSSVLCYSH